jgi:Domain of unknown function (DUF4149)
MARSERRVTVSEPMSRSQALAIAILGVWLGWTLFMWFLAGRSFSTVDRVLRASNPQFAEATRPMSPEQTRLVLRHLASEINRTIFRAYGWGQIALGALVLFLLSRQSPRDMFSLVLAGTMLALVLILTLAVTPQIIALGRSIDFLPRNPSPPGFQRFWMLHGAFTGLDGVKLLAGLVLVGRWIFKQ